MIISGCLIFYYLDLPYTMYLAISPTDYLRCSFFFATTNDH
jgi:hypothetical protein